MKVAGRVDILMNEGCWKSRHFNEAQDTLVSLVGWIRADNAEEIGVVNPVDDAGDGFPRDPNNVKAKGRSWGGDRSGGPNAVEYVMV